MLQWYEINTYHLYKPLPIGRDLKTECIEMVNECAHFNLLMHCFINVQNYIRKSHANIIGLLYYTYIYVYCIDLHTLSGISKPLANFK